MGGHDPKAYPMAEEYRRKIAESGMPDEVREQATKEHGRLERKGAEFTEIVASSDPAKKQEMIQKSGGRMTFPQIFINGKHVGGSDDLHALDARGGLDPLLEA